MKKYEHPTIEVVVFDSDVMAGVDISAADVVTDIVGTEDGGDY